jgi:hypothetical protein
LRRGARAGGLCLLAEWRCVVSKPDETVPAQPILTPPPADAGKSAHSPSGAAEPVTDSGAPGFDRGVSSGLGGTADAVTPAERSDWRDVQDDPWQPDEDAPPPVVGQ